MARQASRRRSLSWLVVAPTAEHLSYRFALRPKWLLLHLAAVLALGVMVAACFWQLSRLEEKQDRNRLYDARAAEPVEPVGDVVSAGASHEEAEGARFRLLEATGEYRPDEEVFVRSRSLGGQPGAWVLTPLVLADRPGVAVVVNRGWIPANTTTPTMPAGAEAPSGTVTVTGLALPGETRGAFGGVDASGSRLRVLARADLGRLQEQVEEALLPVYLQLQSQQPPASQVLPAIIPPPAQDEGPHRSYAGQWAIFAVIWLVGYPLLVRRAARHRAQDRDEDEHDDEDTSGADRASHPVLADGATGAGEGADVGTPAR
jgi:cytochrome oxidase assembly protein ShyY1